MSKLFILKFMRSVFRLIPNSLFNVLIEQLFLSKNINPLRYIYSRIGIYKPENIKEVLKSEMLRPFLENKKLTVFDVGANIGDFSHEFLLAKPESNIWSFEPLPKIFELLNERFKQTKNIICTNVALDNKQGKRKIYSYKNSEKSEHSTLHKAVIEDLHNSNEVWSVDTITDTLDNFCTERQINSIDYLKIDTEGNELDILRGACFLLQENKIRIIQFEFNEMHIVSRVFLKDFYDLLQSFSFYRINQDHLIPLDKYQSINEIHQFQNIIAINDQRSV